MRQKTIDLIRSWWPVISAVVGVIFFFGLWYMRTCSLESSMADVAGKVDKMTERVDRLEKNVSSLEYSVVDTRETVRDIQNILLREQTLKAFSAN